MRLIADSWATSPTNPRDFERVLCRAAALCWLDRFRRQMSKGDYALTQYQIGDTAGAVWEVLSRKGPLPFAELLEEADVPQSLFFMAIGWLSREDKLKFEPAGGDYIVRLA